MKKLEPIKLKATPAMGTIWNKIVEDCNKIIDLQNQTEEDRKKPYPFFF